MPKCYLIQIPTVVTFSTSTGTKVSLYTDSTYDKEFSHCCKWACIELRVSQKKINILNAGSQIMFHFAYYFLKLQTYSNVSFCLLLLKASDL
jgi:hypothetical protein